jgi:hypothetical protein
LSTIKIKIMTITTRKFKKKSEKYDIRPLYSLNNGLHQ